MQLLKKILENKYFTSSLFIFFILIYFIVYGRYGWNDTDGGYILSASWRIFNGQLPYRDFIFVTPPLTIFLHSLTFFLVPENYQLIFERLLFYLFLASSSYFASATIDQVFRLSKIGLDKYLLATIGFVFSVHNFPPMPWYTVDGLFFASIGIYILVKYSSLYSIVCGTFFIFLSATCKQSFYLMPFAGIFFVFLVHKDWNKTIVAILSLILFLGIYLFLLYKLGILTDFAALTSGRVKNNELVNYLILAYFNVRSVYIILTVFFWIIMRQLPNLFPQNKNISLVPYFFISVLLIYPVLEMFICALFNKQLLYAFFFQPEAARLLFLTTIFFLLANFSFEKKWICLWLLTILSWSASASNGYPTPELFSVPLIFSFFLISNQVFEVKNITLLAVYLLLSGTIIFFIEFERPYGNPPAHNAFKYKLSEFFPKTRYINVEKETFEKYYELKTLISRYGNNFKTLPAVCLSNYLSNTISPIEMDWVVNTNNRSLDSKLIESLSQKKPTVFIEKHVLNSPELNKTRYAVANFIKTNWQKVDSTKYFDIYKFK